MSIEETKITKKFSIAGAVGKDADYMCEFGGNMAYLAGTFAMAAASLCGQMPARSLIVGMVTSAAFDKAIKTAPRFARWLKKHNSKLAAQL